MNLEEEHTPFIPIFEALGQASGFSEAVIRFHKVNEDGNEEVIFNKEKFPLSTDINVAAIVDSIRDYNTSMILTNILHVIEKWEHTYTNPMPREQIAFREGVKPTLVNYTLFNVIDSDVFYHTVCAFKEIYENSKLSLLMEKPEHKDKTIKLIVGGDYLTIEYLSSQLDKLQEQLPFGIVQVTDTNDVRIVNELILAIVIDSPEIDKLHPLFFGAFIYIDPLKNPELCYDGKSVYGHRSSVIMNLPIIATIKLEFN